jgi:hypothetical protein
MAQTPLVPDEIVPRVRRGCPRFKTGVVDFADSGEGFEGVRKLLDRFDYVDRCGDGEEERGSYTADSTVMLVLGLGG